MIESEGLPGKPHTGIAREGVKNASDNVSL
jgi:hypothetical protein